MAGTTGRGVVVADRCLFITTARSRRSTRFARSASAPAGWTCNPSTIWLRFRGEDAAWRASGVILMRLSRPKDCALIYQVKLGSDENTFAGPSPSEIVWERLHATKLAGTHLCRRGIARHIHPAPCQRCLSSYVNSMMARENGRVLVSLPSHSQIEITAHLMRPSPPLVPLYLIHCTPPKSTATFDICCYWGVHLTNRQTGNTQGALTLQLTSA
eukprot:scaffold157138_cov27-Tisochrysis_lutea.AAC.1